MNLAQVAVTLAKILQTGNAVFLAYNEQQAVALAAVLAALLPSSQVFLVPSSDTLPGDNAPASPANAGRRLATLRAMRLAGGTSCNVVCILSGDTTLNLPRLRFNHRRVYRTAKF
ncbi:MAG: hypothetical protein M3Y22_13595 [Pseudomonadota bacterium]|nr:hypothetical protein [Pseudomonadota bacterium]